MNRRDFLQGLAAAGTAGALAPAGGAQGRAGSTGKMKRLGSTTISFRERFPSTRSKGTVPTEPDLTLPDIPALFADRLGVHNVELWSRHFDDTSLAYCEKIRAAAEKVKSRIINLQFDGSYNLSARDPEVRKKSIEMVKAGIDQAAALGASSFRANTGGSPREEFDVSVTADSYRQLAEYAESKGLISLVENHGGHSARAENVVKIIEAVKHPACRSLPDFGNLPPGVGEEYRFEMLKMMFPYAYLVSAKGMDFDENLNHVTFDIGACVRIGEQAGFKGIYSVELWSPKPQTFDPFKATAKVFEIILQNI